MPTTRSLKHMVFSTLLGLLPLQPTLLVAAQEGLPLRGELVSTGQQDSPGGTGTPNRFDVSGGRGPRHCALAIGVLVGGALGFWGNPILGVTLLRFGLMASVLHCDLAVGAALPEGRLA